MSATDALVTIDQLSSVIQQTATDTAFRQVLLSDPTAALQSAGITIPEGAEVQVVEHTQTLRYAVVPARPADLSDADLEQSVSESLPSPGSIADNIASYAQLVAKSWTDSTLRSLLLADPGATLAAHGIQVPAGVTVQAVESTASNPVVSIPPSVSSSSIASSLTNNFTGLAKLITAGAYLAGLGFAAGAVLKFKAHKDNPTQVPIGTPIALIYVSAALLFLPTL